MTKLDEIEARAAIIALPAHPLSGEIQKDFDLLIRAVRQLGRIVKERESKSITANRIEHGSLDLDVLELFE